MHLLFVLVKILRVPPGNPLVWQLSLTGELTHLSHALPLSRKTHPNEQRHRLDCGWS